MEAQEQLHQAGGVLRTLGQQLQGGGRADQLHRNGLGAAGHRGEGQQHKHTAGDGGVCKVLAQTAEQTLDHHDGKGRAHHALPDGHVGAQVQGQQQAGDNGAEVPNGLLFAGNHIEQSLADHGSDDAGGDDAQGLGAEDDDAGNGGGQQGDDHIQHDPPGRIPRMDMGRG